MSGTLADVSLVSILVGLLTVLQAIIGYGVVRVLSSQRDHGRELIKLRMILTGENGENGIKGNVAELKETAKMTEYRFQRLEGAVNLDPLMDRRT